MSDPLQSKANPTLPNNSDEVVKSKINSIIKANTDEWGQADMKQIGQEVVWLMKSKEGDRE